MSNIGENGVTRRDLSGVPRIDVLVLGGTITMTPNDVGGIVPSEAGANVLRDVPGLADLADVRISWPFLVPGPSLTPEHLAKVVALVRGAFDDGATGVVIAQGTDTIDEVAFLLDLVLVGDAPVVVTGAMRGAAAAGADGPANLLAAVTVAASSEARGQGVLVVLNDEVHSARYVTKTDTAALGTFKSLGYGPLGYVSEGRVRLSSNCSRTVLANGFDLADMAPVAIVKTGLGDDGRQLDALASQGFAGCVLEAMGAGHVPQPVAERAEALTEFMPVLLATRVPSGRVFTQTYGFPGSEMDLIRRGLIPVGGLPPHKARLLLACLCGAGADRCAVKAAFEAIS